MKIRHPFLIALAAFLAAFFIRALNRTLRFRHVEMGDQPPRCLWGFWHEDMIVPAHRYRWMIRNYWRERPDYHVLISRHADGKLIARTIEWLSLKVVAGSTSRGATEAVLKLIQLSRSSHLGITPDGPRGPRQCVQPGIVYVAARTGLPLMVVGFGYSRAWRMKSWDRMAIPKPFSRVIAVMMPPIYVPNVDDRDQLEGYRQTVEAQMREASRLAQGIADGTITDGDSTIGCTQKAA